MRYFPQLVSLAALAASSAAHAELVNLEITSVAPAFDGESFGSVGTYQRINAVAHHRLDPTEAINAGIVNIGLAPREADGKIAYDTDVVMFVPADRSKANGQMLYELVNRGNPLAFGNFNDADGWNAGNGFLMKQGYSLVFSGWQAAYPIDGENSWSISIASRFSDPKKNGLLFARLPVATNPDGSPVIGQTTEQFSDRGPAQTFTVNLTYPAASLKQRTQLRVRQKEADTATTPAGLKWRFLDDWRIEVTQAPGTSDAAIYEFTYVAKDPIVYGLALTSMRDLVSYLRYDHTSGNPLAQVGTKGIEDVIGFGASQTGRTIKELLYEFNDDAAGRKVFDGAMIFVSGAGKNAVNSQFSKPGIKESQHGYRGVRGDEFPFSYPFTFDPLSRQWGGILARCEGTGTCPKIFHIDSENELWHGGALSFVDTSGHDLAIPDNVRLFVIAGAEHNSRPTGKSAPICMVPSSSGIKWTPFARALLNRMDDWVTKGTEPPHSLYPSRAAGQLVTPDEFAFPNLPQVHFYGAVGRRYLWDRSTEPPVAIADYPVFVPQTDKDGNILGGLRHPFMDVPLATNTGWNLRAAGHGEGDICIASGMNIPFSATEAQAKSAGDPRLPVSLRYASREDYLTQVKARADRLVKEGLLLPADRDDIMQQADHLADGSAAAWGK